MRSVWLMMLAACAACRPASAETVEEFYRDRTITLLIGYGPGGGYDQYARLLARHMSQFIPGKPQIQPKNLPGAGSMNAINSAYNVGPRDGKMMATFGPEVAFEPLRNGEGVKFDTLKFNWIGSMNRQVSIAVMTKASGIRDILDARTKTVSVGASGAGSQSSLNPFVYNAFLGTRFKVVTGYPGTKEITMAVERGELDGIAGWSWDSLKLERPGWASNPDVHVVMQVSDRRHREIPDVPNMYDYVASPDDRSTMGVIFGHQLLGRPFMVAPGVPPERVKALQQAFDKTLRDPAFLKDAETMRLEIDSVTGDEIDRHVKKIFGLPKSLIEKAEHTIKAATKSD